MACCCLCCVVFCYRCLCASFVIDSALLSGVFCCVFVVFVCPFRFDECGCAFGL